MQKGGDIVIWKESGTYGPEMEWIAARLNQQFAVIPQSRDDSGSLRNSQRARVNAPGYSWRVIPAENYEAQNGRAVYRFFELFDLPNIPGIEKTLRAST